VYPEGKNHVGLQLKPLALWAPCKARWVWVGAVPKYFLATCLSQFAKAATLSQQEKNNTAVVKKYELTLMIDAIKIIIHFVSDVSITFVE
jgi:hypothetical protein